MAAETHPSGAGADGVSARSTRRALVERHLARSDDYWTRAVIELRESLLEMAGDLDELRRRVRELESRVTRD